MTVTEHTRHTTASMVIIDPSTAQVLLVLHKATGKWVFPGGHVDENEAPHEAAIREVGEETGLTVTLMSRGKIRRGPSAAHPVPFDVQEFDAPAKPHKGEPAHHHIDFLYIGFADSAQPLVRAETEVDDAQWVTWFDLSFGRIDAREEVAEVAYEAIHTWG